MAQTGTKKVKRSFYRSVDRTFQEDLNRFFKELTQNNHYVAFLYEQILRDLKSLSREHDQGSEESGLTAHSIPTTKGFPFLPLHFDLTDPVYDRELEERSDWLRAGGDSDSYDYFVLEERIAQKRSRILKRLFSLSMDFSDFVKKIHEEHRIPVHSLIEIFSVMTSEEEIVQCLKEGFPKRTVLIPQDVPAEERDKRLLNISGQIYNVWLECLLLLSLLGIIEMVIINRLFSDNDFEKAQEYLLHTACYYEMEDRINGASSIEDLKKYMEEEFTVFKSFIPGFLQFYEKNVRFWVKKGAFLERRGTPIRIDPSVVTQVYEDSDPEKIELKALQSILEDDVSKPMALDERELEVLDEGEDGEPATSITAGSDDHSEEKDPPPIRKRKGKHKEDDGDSKPFESDEEAFYGDMNLKFGKKWLKGLVFTYKLKGSPLDLMVYLRGIFIKLALSVMGENYNALLKSKIGISHRTGRRWEKELKEGRWDEELKEGEDLSEFGGEDRRPRSIKNLSVDDIDNIILKKEERQKHHSPESLTKGQVIRMLMDHTSRRALEKRAGVRIPEYSRTTLKRKIKKLLALNTIRFHKEGKIYRFERSQENIINIVKEMVKL
jgi:hypothetical protein